MLFTPKQNLTGFKIKSFGSTWQWIYYYMLLSNYPVSCEKQLDGSYKISIHGNGDYDFFMPKAEK